MIRPAESASCTLIVATCIALGCLPGCAATPDTAANDQEPSPDPSDPTQPRLHEPQDAVVATVIDARPAALIDGRTVRWGDLRPMLTEQAGAQALQELILHRTLERMAVERGVFVTEERLAAERALLMETLHDDPDVAVRLLGELRSRQGLGPMRFRMLLTRNAIMRRLVQEHVSVDEQQVHRMYDLRYGPKRQARLMLLPNLQQAEQAIRRLEAGESFADVAIDMSIDRSAARGGLLEPISRFDLSYPRPLLDTLWELSAGDVSSPILLDNGYALLHLERIFPAADVEFDHVRDEMQRLARLHQERTLMEELGRRILREAQVTIYDEHLQSSWRQRGRWTIE